MPPCGRRNVSCVPTRLRQRGHLIVSCASTEEAISDDPDSHRLLFGRGMISDDTEHACLVAQALVTSAGGPDRFTTELASRLRWWLLSLPPAIGVATLSALVRLLLGVPAHRSGVNSAGNGPAMRAAILGAAIDDLDQLTELVHRTTIITHRDPRAEWGALAVALAAHHARHHQGLDAPRYLAAVQQRLPPEARELVESLARAMGGEPVSAFAASLGLSGGVSGYVNHTVPVAICAWARHPRDLVTAVQEVIRCGGDTDSVAAIVGGIVGAGVGWEEIPQSLLTHIRDWPRTTAWIEALGRQLERVMASRVPEVPIEVRFPAVVLRNLFFLGIVLFHGFRRLFPPY